MNIGASCPICKEDTDYTKLYLTLHCNDCEDLKKELNILRKKAEQMEQLSQAQARSIIERSDKIWQAENKIKALHKENMILRNIVNNNIMNSESKYAIKSGNVHASSMADIANNQFQKKHDYTDCGIRLSLMTNQINYINLNKTSSINTKKIINPFASDPYSHDRSI